MKKFRTPLAKLNGLAPRSFTDAACGFVIQEARKQRPGDDLGLTGTCWTVEASGKWTVERIIGRDANITKHGQLSAKELEALATKLSEYDINRLPARIGGSTINPHLIRIKYGDRQSELKLPSAAPIPKKEPDKQMDSKARLGEALLALRELIPN